MNILDIPNGSITWDMLYYPNLTSAVGYVHHVAFVVSTVLTPPTAYIILKKSTEPMGFYKYVLLQNIIINYILDMYYYLMRPVFLLPYLMFYFDGALKNIDSGYGVIMMYFFLFILIWIYGSWISASIYRISKVFPLSKITGFLESPKNYVMVHVGVIICFEMIMTFPFATFLFQPYNSTVALEYVIVDQPAYANFSKLNPPITIMGCDFKNYCRLFLNLTEMACFLFGLLASIIGIGIVPVYLVKVRHLSHASNSTAKLNKMLFIALLVQSAILCAWLVFFWLTLFFLVFKLPYGVLISQLWSSITLFYPILEIMVLLYFIKPYHQYVKEIMEKLSLLWCVKTILHGTQTQAQTTIVQPPNIKLFVFRKSNAQSDKRKEGDK